VDGVKEPSSGRTGEAHRREGFQLGYVSTRDELLKVENLCSEYIKGGRHGYHDEALMGMGIESVRIQEGRFEILSPGACMTLHADGMLNVRQRIGAERELLSCRLPEHLSPWRLALWTPFRCVLEGNGLELTIQGDSVLIFSPQQHVRLTFEGHFQPQYCPPRPRDEERYFQSISYEGSSEVPCPSNEIIRSAAKHCQIFTLHSGWETDAPE